MAKGADSALQRIVDLVTDASAFDPAAPDERDAVRNLELADAIERASHAHLMHTVAIARARGVSWQAIGESFGITRQAAYKRFGTPATTDRGEVTMSKPTIDLIERTEKIFADLSNGDYAGVKALMTFTCSRILTKKKVMGVWEQVLTESGQFESCSETVVQTADGRNILLQQINQYLAGGLICQSQVNHEAGEWIGRVSYNGSGKITGLLIVHPMQAQNLPF